MSSGRLDVLKDGQSVDVGRFGGGLVDATSDNPRAHEEAKTFRSMVIGGFVVQIVGIPTAAVGAGMTIYNEAHDQDLDLRIAGNALLLGGLASWAVGAMVELGAQPHFYDAVNIYNDDLIRAHGDPAAPVAPAPRSPVPPPPPPPQPTPKAPASEAPTEPGAPPAPPTDPAGP
jgi:hypothetical protein